VKTSTTADVAIRLVIFDWAGTLVDHGSIAPIAALVAAFNELGLKLTESEARGPMGLPKRDHIGLLLQSASISAQWLQTFGRQPTRADGDSLYERFLPLQIAEAKKRTLLIPGVLKCCAALRDKKIAIGTTTGYPRKVGEVVVEAARNQGLIPDHCVYTDDVPAGRPAPWMIFRNMEATGVMPPSAVVKVGDTVPDIEEGHNAGCWTIGITETGSEIGLDLEGWRGLTSAEREQRSNAAASKLLDAGAHLLARSVAEVPMMIDRINSGLASASDPDDRERRRDFALD
jgi:phosphonoacetaldehyde hydrolase